MEENKMILIILILIGIIVAGLFWQPEFCGCGFCNGYNRYDSKNEFEDLIGEGNLKNKLKTKIIEEQKQGYKPYKIQDYQNK